MDDLESCTMVRFPEDIAAQLHEHLDDKEEVDLTQHLTWDLTGLHGDKIRRLQDEATKLVEQLNKNKIRRQKKEAELEAAHKEEKKERLRQEIEETRRKEQDKTNAYIECVKKKEKKY